MNDSTAPVQEIHIGSYKRSKKNKRKRIEKERVFGPRDYSQFKKLISVFVLDEGDPMIFLDAMVYILYTSMYGDELKDLKMTHFKVNELVSQDNIPLTHLTLSLVPKETQSKCEDKSIIKVDLRSDNFTVTLYVSKESLFVTVMKCEEVEWKDVGSEVFQVVDKSKLRSEDGQ